MALDPTVNVLNYHEAGGAVWHVGGELRIEAGGKLTAAGTQATAITATTDNTGGTASNTAAAITAGASYAQADMVAAKNAIASLIANQNAILTVLHNLGFTT